MEELTDVMELIGRVVPRMRESGNLQWDDHYPNDFAFISDIEKGLLWVAEIDGKIVGIAAITTDQAPEYADVGWDITETAIVVHRLAVDLAYRGRGIAAALMQQAESLASQRGIQAVRVDTNTENQATQKLLPKLGYVCAGEIGLAFRPGLRFLCYEKRVHLPVQARASTGLFGGTATAIAWQGSDQVRNPSNVLDAVSPRRWWRYVDRSSQWVQAGPAASTGEGDPVCCSLGASWATG